MRTRLNTTKALVKNVLEREPKTRNSDSYLYFRIISIIADKHNIDLNGIPVTAFLLNMNDFPFPPFESVRRSRQKVQEHFPNLAASPEVELFRAENEQAYVDFARGARA